MAWGKRVRVEDLARPSEFVSDVSIQMRFNDVDALGHVNNSMYQQYFDLGRVDYFLRMPGPRPTWWGAAVVVASLSIDFFTSLLPTDEASVCTRIIGVSNRSFCMEQLLYKRDAQQTVCARCESVMSGFDAQRGCAAPLPESWKRKIVELENLKG